MDMTKRYTFVNGSIKLVPYDYGLVSPSYDDVVDKSQFRPNAETVRSSSVSVGSLGRGVYDDPDNPPSEIEVLIRSGKLDRAEIDDIVRLKKEQVQKAVDLDEKEAALNEQNKINEARQAHLDQVTGFTGLPQDS